MKSSKVRILHTLKPVLPVLMALLPLIGFAAWTLIDWEQGVALLGCVLLSMIGLKWAGQRALRADSQRLMQLARHPEEGARMAVSELAEAARVIAHEQQRVRDSAEEARRNAARLEEVQRAASIGWWRCDVASLAIEGSSQTFAIFGVSVGETVTLQCFFDLVHPLDRAAVTESQVALFAGTEDLDVAYRIVRANGDERFLHARGAVATRSIDGRPTAVVGTVQDVTQAWESAGLSGALERVLSLSGDAVLLTREVDGVWQRVWSNPTWERLCEDMGLAGRDADYQLFDPQVGLLKNDAAAVRRAREHHLAQRLDLTLVTAHGISSYEAELIPQSGAPGRPVHGLLLLRDRSAEREAGRLLQQLNTQLESTVAQRTVELARRERLYRVLADLSPQIVWQADRDGAATYLNRAWYDLVGPRQGDWLGMRWLDALHPDDVLPSRTAFSVAGQAQQTSQVRRRIRTRQGSYRSFLSVAAQVRGPDGGFESWAGVDTDITELEGDAERLQQMNDELETFSYTVSHDLRAPVQVIKGFVEALLARQVGQIDNAARGYLVRVLRNARRMEDLIADLLALARLSREPLRPSRFDPMRLARSLVDVIQERYPQRVIECLVRGEGIEIEADRRLFHVLLENLMDNAVKFSAEKAVCHIDVGAWRELDETVIEVADRGVGFPAELAHRLFRPFQRLHSSDAFPGAGVGLATVARIVKLHGGTISADIRQGGGALFRIRLPLEALPPRREAAAPELA